MAGVKIYIDGVEILAREGQTVLDSAAENGVHIPALCFLKDCCGVAECRMCVVEVEGQTRPLTACTTAVREGMKILTRSDRVREYRRRSLELMCRAHRMDCEYCSRYGDCEFHALMRELGLDDRKFSRYRGGRITDESLAGFGFDSSKCVLCRRCVESCKKQGMNILTVLSRGKDARVGSYAPLGDTDCIQCGQCLAACLTGAFYERNDMMTVWNALERGLNVAFVLAPEVGAVIGECFGEAVGTDCEARLVGILRRMGIKRVYRQSEAPPERGAGGLAVSARCPAVTELVRKRYPELESLVEGKPPLERTAEEVRAFRQDTFVVAVGPCSAGKKHGFGADVYMTVTELADFIRRGCVSRFTAMDVWKNTAPSGFDSLCRRIAGMSAAGYSVKTDKMPEVIALLDKMLSGELTHGRYELLACEGGCLVGGGTPRISGTQRISGTVREYSNR